MGCYQNIFIRKKRKKKKVISKLKQFNRIALLFVYLSSGCEILTKKRFSHSFHRSYILFITEVEHRRR